MEALFGRTLRRARESVDVSASELAAALGVHPSSVHAWESGLHGPMAWRLFAIADALGLPVSHLLEGR
jgi:transcriptional regulator with XRE-family HTH domain